MIAKTLHIREANSADVPVLSGLIRHSFRDVATRFGLTRANCPRHPSNCTDEWIDTDFARGVTYYILERGGTPVGCVALEKALSDFYYLERLAVLPQYRHNGFGKALVDHVLFEAKRLGAKKLNIGIIAEQTELKLWYRQQGFVEEETKEFQHLPFFVTFMTYAF